MSYTKIILKSGKDQSLYRRHPWVFSGAIKKTYGPLNEGDVVEVFNNKDEFLATGHYQIGTIAVRVLSFEQTDPGYDLWIKRIQNAWQLREQAGIRNAATNVFRLINAEGDNMPGLIIDYYNGVAVMQMHSIGMYLAKDEIIKALQDVLGDALTAVYDKSEGTIPFKSGIEPKNGYVWGEAPGSDLIVLENGLKFKPNWVEGQKTGFFIDQRYNRSLLGKYAANRKVLNMFCYTGGFSVYALKGDASLVHSVDSSQSAIELTRENVALNGFDPSRHEAFATDAFGYLDNMDNSYDLIILDPPAFAKHNNVLHNALQGYKKLNAKAFDKIKPGGILFTFSCSQVVSKDNFRKSVFAAAANSGREVRILHQLTQPADHPVNIYHPEGEYLKGLVLYVD